MSILKYKYHTSQTQVQDFDQFIAKAIDSFTGELNKIADCFYSYERSPDGFRGFDNVFKIIERTWVGIFQSALLKTDPNIISMQEFNILNGERVFGRCDLLFEWNNGARNQIITEAKSYEFINDWGESLSDSFFNRILNQAYGYYESEREYYTQNTYLLALVFEWIRDTNRLEQAKKLMDNWSLNVNPDFISLIAGERRGVFVYGKIVDAKSFKC